MGPWQELIHEFFGQCSDHGSAVGSGHLTGRVHRFKSKVFADLQSFSGHSSALPLLARYEDPDSGRYGLVRRVMGRGLVLGQKRRLATPCELGGRVLVPVAVRDRAGGCRGHVAQEPKRQG